MRGTASRREAKDDSRLKASRPKDKPEVDDVHHRKAVERDSGRDAIGEEASDDDNTRKADKARAEYNAKARAKLRTDKIKAKRVNALYGKTKAGKAIPDMIYPEENRARLNTHGEEGMSDKASSGSESGSGSGSSDDEDNNTKAERARKKYHKEMRKADRKIVKQMQTAMEKAKKTGSLHLQGIGKGKGSSKREPNNESHPRPPPPPPPPPPQIRQEAHDAKRSAKREQDDAQRSSDKPRADDLKASFNHDKGKIKQAAKRLEETEFVRHSVNTAITGRGSNTLKARMSISHAQSLSSVQLINLKRGLDAATLPYDMPDKDEKRLAKFKDLVADQIAWRLKLRKSK